MPGEGEGIVLTAQGPYSSLFPRNRVSFSLRQRCDVTAVGRDAIEGQPEIRGAVHVRVHYRDAACDSGHCGLYWYTCCFKRTKISLASRLRCPADTRSSLHPYTCCGSIDCHPDARRGSERHIRYCLDPGCQRQNSGDRPLQLSCGIACDYGWHRGCCEHNIRRAVDSASRIPSVFSRLSEYCLARFCIALVRRP